MYPIKKYWFHFATGSALLVAALLFPWLTETYWFGMVSKIREAITTGDTGNLVLAAASHSINGTFQNTLSFIGLVSLFLFLEHFSKLGHELFYGGILISFGLFNYSWSLVALSPWEPICSLIAAGVTLLLIRSGLRRRETLFRISVIALQTFFAFQWLNIMPVLSRFYFGVTDIPNSIKRTSIYLESIEVLNFVGLAFYLPIFISAGVTAAMFYSVDRYIAIAKENYDKEKALDAIRSKALEHRIYQEIHTLTHDLKTPLVTIRGLSSLLSISRDMGKIVEYTERIDGSVEKMSEMITSFLFGSSRKRLSVEELMTYVRAQLPIENDELSVTIEREEDLPDLYANKIRMVRALINIIENAMVVPTKNDLKTIEIRVFREQDMITFSISDNGIGIPKDKLDAVWAVGFSTGESSGLGLSFTKKVIEDNKGHVKIESSVNVGTTVTIKLPIATEEDEWGDNSAEEDTRY